MKIFLVKDERGNCTEVGAVSRRDLKDSIPNMDLDIEFKKIKIEKSTNNVAWFDKCDSYIDQVQLTNGENLMYWTPSFENKLKKSDLELK